MPTELPTGTVTFLFTDLEGSTRLWEEHPEAMEPSLARHDAILRDAVVAHDGYVVKMRGDGAHAAFANATNAVHAARDAQRALVAEDWGPAGELRVRMGIHTGPAEARDGDYYGSAVNRAARLMSAAHGGQIVVSLATEELARDALSDEVELVDLGEHLLRDLSRPERIFEVRAPDLASGFPGLQTLDAYPTNLPLQLSSFVGRESELRSDRGGDAASRLVTITGVGGVGKTRLAVQIAAELLPDFPDGAWLCELAGVSDADGVAQLVASTLGVREHAEVGLESSIAEFLRRRTALLVLDNCEHVLDAAARLAAKVLQTCPDVYVVATSREGLAVEGERVWPLRSLPIPSADEPPEMIAASDAVQLFVERAVMARPASRWTARTRQPSPTSAGASTASRSPSSLPLHACPRCVRTRSPRVSTSGSVCSRAVGGRPSSAIRRCAPRWTGPTRCSTRTSSASSPRLGVFAGGFDAAAAEEVVAGDGIEAWDVVDAVASLVDKSMLVDEEPIVDTTRYGMLETLRQYAIEQLAASDDVDAWRRRHAAHFGGVAETIGEGLLGPDELQWQQRLRADLEHLRAAVTWSFDRAGADDVELGIAIIAALASEAFHHQATVSSWAELAVEHLETTTTERRATVLSAAAASAMTRRRLRDRAAEGARSVRRGSGRCVARARHSRRWCSVTASS